MSEATSGTTLQRLALPSNAPTLNEAGTELVAVRRQRGAFGVSFATRTPNAYWNRRKEKEKSALLCDERTGRR